MNKKSATYFLQRDAMDCGTACLAMVLKHYVEQFLTSNSLSLLFYSILFSFFTFIIFSIVLSYYNLLIFGVFVVGTLLYASWITLFLKKRRTLDYK